MVTVLAVVVISSLWGVELTAWPPRQYEFNLSGYGAVNILGHRVFPRSSSIILCLRQEEMIKINSIRHEEHLVSDSQRLEKVIASGMPIASSELYRTVNLLYVEPLAVSRVPENLEHVKPAVLCSTL